MGSALACEYAWLGRVPYEEAWSLQKRLASERAAGERPDTLLLLEHPPVFTTGRRDARFNLRLPPEMLGAPLINTDHGGDITFHGPGQLIAYPIMDLRAAGLGVVEYVRNLEETIISTLRGYGIESGLECGRTGVWVPQPSVSGTADCPSPAHGRGGRGEGSDKIAAIGVRVSRPGGASGGWITTHGLALNVSVDLAWFDRIVPCGIADRRVTSMERITGSALPLQRIGQELASQFGSVFGRCMVQGQIPDLSPA